MSGRRDRLRDTDMSAGDTAAKSLNTLHQDLYERIEALELRALPGGAIDAEITAGIAAIPVVAGVTVWDSSTEATAVTTDDVTWVTVFTLTPAYGALVTYFFSGLGAYWDGISVAAHHSTGLIQSWSRYRSADVELINSSFWWTHGPDGSMRMTGSVGSVLCQVKGGGAYTMNWKCRLAINTAA